MRKMSEMPYHIGLKVKLYLSYQQKHLVAVNDGAKRAVYNHLVACSNERYRLGKTAEMVPADRKRLDYLDSVTGEVKNIKNALPYLYGDEVDEQAIANAIRNYKAAWKNKKELQACVPAFKKKSYEQSYQTNAHYYRPGSSKFESNVRFEDRNHVILPKLGRVRFGSSPKLICALLERKADTRIGAITISRDAVGEYWASFSIASEEPFYEALPKTGGVHGVDLNLVELVNGSDGASAPNMRFYKRTMKKRAKMQRSLSRMQEQAKKERRSLLVCKNYQKQRIRVAYLNRKVARQRADYLHTLSKREVENQDFIAAEDLKVKNFLKNHCLAGSISDAGWRTFLTMLQYKASMYGKTFILVPPHHTTQTCSVCGHVMKGEEKLTLSVREWNCPECGTHHHRDANAAENILQRGLQAVKQAPHPL